MITRDQFIAWFETLSLQERIDVWYDCNGLTRAEFDQLIADGHAATERVKKLEAWRTEILISQKVGGVDLNGAIAIADAGLAANHVSPLPLSIEEPV